MAETDWPHTFDHVRHMLILAEAHTSEARRLDELSLECRAEAFDSLPASAVLLMHPMLPGCEGFRVRKDPDGWVSWGHAGDSERGIDEGWVRAQWMRRSLRVLDREGNPQ